MTLPSVSLTSSSMSTSSSWSICTSVADLAEAILLALRINAAASLWQKVFVATHGLLAGDRVCAVWGCRRRDRPDLAGVIVTRGTLGRICLHLTLACGIANSSLMQISD